MEFMGMIFWIGLLFILIKIRTTKIKGESRESILQKLDLERTRPKHPPVRPVQTKSQINNQTISQTKKQDKWENFNRSGASYKQQETKQRLMDKYNTSAEKATAKSAYVPVGAAVTRSVQNAHQLQKDVIVYAKEPVETKDLMMELSDIMVKGIFTELTFDRDIIAEGADMLNSIQTI